MTAKDKKIIEDSEARGIPIFVLTAKDHHSTSTLIAYMAKCANDCSIQHVRGVSERVQDFLKWQEDNPDKLNYLISMNAKALIFGIAGYLIAFAAMWNFLPKEVPVWIYVILFVICSLIWTAYCLKKPKSKTTKTNKDLLIEKQAEYINYLKSCKTWKGKEDSEFEAVKHCIMFEAEISDLKNNLDVHS